MFEQDMEKSAMRSLVQQVLEDGRKQEAIYQDGKWNMKLFCCPAHTALNLGINVMKLSFYAMSVGMRDGLPPQAILQMSEGAPYTMRLETAWRILSVGGIEWGDFPFTVEQMEEGLRRDVGERMDFYRMMVSDVYGVVKKSYEASHSPSSLGEYTIALPSGSSLESVMEAMREAVKSQAQASDFSEKSSAAVSSSKGKGKGKKNGKSE